MCSIQTSNLAWSQEVLKWLGHAICPNCISYVASCDRTASGNSTFKNLCDSCQQTFMKQSPKGQLPECLYSCLSLDGPHCATHRGLIPQVGTVCIQSDELANVALITNGQLHLQWRGKKCVQLCGDNTGPYSLRSW